MLKLGQDIKSNMTCSRHICDEILVRDIKQGIMPQLLNATN